MARATEAPPATASVVERSSYELGATRTGWRAARRRDPHTGADERLRGAPGLVAAGPVLPRAGRPARRLRPQTWVHPRRVPAGGRAPVRRVVGLPGHVVLRADRAVRHARRLPATSSTGCTRPASASSSTGCPRTSPRTRGRWPASTAPRCTSTPTRAAASSPTGARSCSTSAAREVRNFLVANARLLARGVPRRRAAGRRGRLDALPRLLARGRASGRPNVYGGRENLDAVSFLQETNATVYKRVPGIVMIAEESTAWPGVTRPTDLGRPRASASSGTWAGCTTRSATSRTSRCTARATTTR